MCIIPLILLKGFKEEILQFSRSQWFFIMLAMICGFCIMFDYGIVRPVSNSVFITSYGSNFFPYAWLAIVPLSFLIVELYNRFLAKLGVLKMFLAIIATISVINVFCALYMSKISFLPFFFYVWKEIYVMLLFQQLWSVIHSTLQMKQAKYIYGLIFAVGGVGGILGNIVPGYFAVKMGSSNLLFFSIPLFAVMTIAFKYLVRPVNTAPEEQSINNFWEGVTAIRNSKYLSFILSIVLLMQVTTTLIYYQFNSMLESSIQLQDLRTEYCGKVFVIANITTVFFQLFGSFLFVHFFGLRRSHILLPLILSLNAIGSLFVPTFSMISAAFITIKAFDFSLFGVLKEMLYIPLRKEEKFQAKSIIDVFAYRSAKAVAAGFILILQTAGFIQMIDSITWMTVFLLLLWTFVVYKMFQLKEESVETDIS